MSRHTNPDIESPLQGEETPSPNTVYLLSVSYHFTREQEIEHSVSKQEAHILAKGNYEHAGELLHDHVEEAREFYLAADVLEEEVEDEYGPPVDDLTGVEVPESGIQLSDDLTRDIKRAETHVCVFASLSLMTKGVCHFRGNTGEVVELSGYGELGEDAIRWGAEELAQQSDTPIEQKANPDQYHGLDEFAGESR